VFACTEQLGTEDKFHNAVCLGTSPIVPALVDFDRFMDMVGELDDITFTEWLQQLGGKRGSLDCMWDAIAYALGHRQSYCTSGWTQSPQSAS
jgi:zeta-carotene desaturase